MRNISRGCTVQVHLLDGDPHGIRILGRVGWDGYVLAVPRAEVEAARELEELSRSGVVVLLGSTASNRLRVHVGDADPSARHLPMFLADQRWTQLFVLGREGNLPKALARRIAVLLTETARHTGLADVVDAYPTALREVPPNIRAESEDFVREALMFLALCGVTAFGTSAMPAPGPASMAPTPASPIGPRTTAANTNTQAHSRSRPTKPTATDHRPPAKSSQKVEKAQYDEDMRLLLELGLLRAGQQLIFEQPRKGMRHKAFVEPDGALRLQNTRYVSPSGAAVAAAGTSVNGWICWRTTDGRLLDDLRKRARKRKDKV